VSSAAAALNSNNKLEVYATGVDGNVYYMVQSAPGNWSNSWWLSLQALGNTPAIMSGIVVSNNLGSKRLEAFGVGMRGTDEDNTFALWHITQTAPSDWTNSTWTSLGGTWISAPAVALDSKNCIHVFAVGDNSELYYLAQTSAGTWPAEPKWTTLEGTNFSDPAVGVNSDGTLEVFVLGDNSQVYHGWQKSAGKDDWALWASLAGNNTARPAVAIDSNNHLNLFEIGVEGMLWYAAQTNWNWAQIGGTNTSDPVVATNADGRLEVFLLGDNGKVYSFAQSTKGTWNNPTVTRLGGPWIANPAVARNSTGCLEIFALGTNGYLYTAAQQTAGKWPSDGEASWEQLSAVPLTASDKGFRIRGRGRSRL
jgi:hypothetical protein